MSAAALVHLLLIVVVLAVLVPMTGRYLAAVYGGERAPGDRAFDPVERAVYRLCGIDASGEQRWTGYLRSLLAFSVVGFGVLYRILRVQGTLPGNPVDLGAVPAALAFNTAVSFVTNTNWQAYGGEGTLSHFTQMVGLTVQNFVSAAAGMAVAVAIIRGVARARSATIGSFWVDLTRTITRVLAPMAVVGAVLLVLAGVVQNLSSRSKAEGYVKRVDHRPVGRPSASGATPASPEIELVDDETMRTGEPPQMRGRRRCEQESHPTTPGLRLPKLALGPIGYAISCGHGN